MCCVAPAAARPKTARNSPCLNGMAIMTAPFDGAGGSGAMLALAVEPDSLRACLLDRVGADHRLTGWINVQRNQHSPLTGQLAAITRRMGQRMGRVLWDEDRRSPLLESPDPVGRPPLEHVVAAVNPVGKLRVWLAGLSREVSVTAAAQALQSSPAHLIGHTILSATLESGALTQQLMTHQPDVLIVVGGYDSGAENARTPVLALCRLLGQALARLSPSQYPLIIYAGNRWAAEAGSALLSGTSDSLSATVVDNVCPRPTVINHTDLTRVLQYHHWQIARRAPGLMRLGQWVTEPAQMTSLDWSFAQLVQLWREDKGVAELHGIYAMHHWRLHVRSRRGRSVVDMRYAAFDEPLTPPGWPAPALLSGQPARMQSLPESVRWWDRSGMAALVATAGQVAPVAMMQVLVGDLFIDMVRAP